MIKHTEYLADGIKSVNIDDGLILRVMLGAAKKEEVPFIDEYILQEVRGYSLDSTVESLARKYAESVMECKAPYTVKVDDKTVFEAEADKNYIPHVWTIEELNHFKPHHDRIVVFTQKSNDEEMKAAMEYGYQRIHYDAEHEEVVYAYIRHPYFGRALADCMESAYYWSKVRPLELPDYHPVGLSEWRVFEELKTGNRVAAMVKPDSLNRAFLNVTAWPYMRGNHPEHGNVLIVTASLDSEAAIVTYARACGVKLEIPVPPKDDDEIPF